MMKIVNKDTVFHFLKNPLGLIGLITVVFEAITVAAFSYGVDKLITSHERLPIIWFIVLFPVLVLIVIFLLVVFWHTHLYGPGDYKDEDNFVNVNIRKLERRQNYEAHQLVTEEKKDVTPELIETTKSLIGKAEIYGLNIASEYFGIRLKKDVRLEKSKVKHILFDGMAFKGNKLCVAEVKLLPNDAWRGALERALTTMHSGIQELISNGYDVDAILVIVLKDRVNSELIAKINSEFYTRNYNFELKIASKSAEDLDE